MSQPVIGLDAGGTKLLAGAVDDAGEVLFRRLYPWPGASLDDVLTTVLTAYGEAMSAIGTAEGVGVGLPANMDLAAGVAVSSRHLPIAGFGFRDWLAGELGVPVQVDNDAALALLAEATSGAARGARDALLLTIGTGIGGGLMSAGRLVRGARGAAGEPGHMTIDENGPRCGGDCPGFGCLETYVSGPALARLGYEYAAI